MSKWVQKLPDGVKEKFEVTTNYIRITESPDTWFARAKTAKKGAPEALAGVHGDHVLFLVDEGSGVPIEVFNTAEGALTGENVLFVMISNPTRLIGYFFDSHHGDKKNWQTLSFDSNESPIVDKAYVGRIIEKHGVDSDEFRIRVQGKFPKEDAVDDKGYVPLIAKEKVVYTSNRELVGKKRLGVDCAGAGKDYTVWVLRDAFRARVLAREKVSHPLGIALKTLTLMSEFGVSADEVYVDIFGVGAQVPVELAIAKKFVNGVQVGDHPEFQEDRDRFLNIRALASWRVREWLYRGGELIGKEDWDCIYSMRYRRELSDKIKMMSKEEMRKEGYRSPDEFDALMLTFVEPEDSGEIRVINSRPKTNEYQYSAI